MEKIKYEILTGRPDISDYQIPIFLESSIDEMGIMVGFSGEIEQIEQFCNFTYQGSGNVLTIYNTINTNKLKTYINSVFTISWGDGSSEILEMPTTYMTNLPRSHHVYANHGIYDIEITVDSPWKVEKLKRTITIPIPNGSIPTTFGTLTFTIPYSDPSINQTQQYLEDYRLLTGNTDDTTISFLGIGKSRLDEYRKYGTTNEYTTDVVITDEYTGYTIDGLYYMDYSDGYTHIMALTGNFSHEELYNGKITRDENLIGFIDLPQIYSDVFIERGKQSVMERNLRLGEIDSTGELEIYGSGFFKVKKQ